MLFDLQSTRRRRTTVKIVYAFLAVLMAGGLVFLGVGTGNGNGGFANSLVNNGSGGSSATNQLVTSELKSAAKKIKDSPEAASSWAAMVNARFDLANSGSGYYDSTTGVYTAAGKAQLKQALAAWTKYETLIKGAPSEVTAVEAAHAAAQTGDFAEAAVAWQGVIAAVPTSVQGYTCLALTSYANKNTTLGAEAAAKAVKLTAKLEQLQAKQAFAAAKTQATAKTDAVAECATG